MSIFEKKYHPLPRIQEKFPVSTFSNAAQNFFQNVVAKLWEFLSHCTKLILTCSWHIWKALYVYFNHEFSQNLSTSFSTWNISIFATDFRNRLPDKFRQNFVTSVFFFQKFFPNPSYINFWNKAIFNHKNMKIKLLQHF